MGLRFAAERGTPVPWKGIIVVFRGAALRLWLLLDGSGGSGLWLVVLPWRGWEVGWAGGFRVVGRRMGAAVKLCSIIVVLRASCQGADGEARWDGLHWRSG